MRNALPLVSKLRMLGVRLSADGDNLMVDAPKGVLTEGLLGELRQQKPELLEMLRNQAPLKEVGNATVIDGHQIRRKLWETERAILFEDSEGKLYRYLYAYRRSWPVILVPDDGKKSEKIKNHETRKPDKTVKIQ